MTRKVRPVGWAQEIGGRIREAREARGWPQTELADFLIVHRNTVDNYEAGRGLPNRELPRIAEVLDVSLRWLLHGHEYEDPLLDVQAKLDAVLEVLGERELEAEAAGQAQQRSSGSAQAADGSSDSPPV